MLLIRKGRRNRTITALCAIMRSCAKSKSRRKCIEAGESAHYAANRYPDDLPNRREYTQSYFSGNEGRFVFLILFRRINSMLISSVKRLNENAFWSCAARGLE